MGFFLEIKNEYRRYYNSKRKSNNNNTFDYDVNETDINSFFLSTIRQIIENKDIIKVYSTIYETNTKKSVSFTELLLDIEKKVKSYDLSYQESLNYLSEQPDKIKMDLLQKKFLYETEQQMIQHTLTLLNDEYSSETNSLAQTQKLSYKYMKYKTKYTQLR